MNNIERIGTYTRVTIHEPIWKIPRSVGIAERCMKTHLIILNIDYKLQDGSLLYPYEMIIESKKAKKYPIKYIKGVKLHIIPIERFRK